MPTQNVVVTERQATMMKALVKNGRYQNVSEVMREGLRLVENKETEEALKLDALRAAVQIGIDAAEAGEFKEFADASSLVAYLNDLADATLSKINDK